MLREAVRAIPVPARIPSERSALGFDSVLEGAVLMAPSCRALATKSLLFIVPPRKGRTWYTPGGKPHRNKGPLAKVRAYAHKSCLPQLYNVCGASWADKRFALSLGSLMVSKDLNLLDAS